MTEKTSMGALPLDALPIGRSAVISDVLKKNADISKRLLQLGFRRESDVECVGESPLGGMRAYRVLESIIALRNEDARLILTSYEQQE